VGSGAGNAGDDPRHDCGVTIFLHRHQAHRALDLGPIPSISFRLWLWMTTGMVTKEWAAIHRKHHAKCETVDDPHSPQQVGLPRVCLVAFSSM
jgi:stearoyl-CoA desaturase (delta-9 desaturase)